MSQLKVFVSQAWPETADRVWAEQFATALRRPRVAVVEERSIRDQESRDAAERGRRESDLIVSLLDPDGPESPNFYFEYGVATFGGKAFVAVVPEGVDPERLPVPFHGVQYVRQGS